MKLQSTRAVFVFLLVSGLAGLGGVDQTRAAAEISLDQLLQRIEKSGSGIKSLRASIEQKKWTEILEEYDAGERGQLIFLKSGGQSYIRKDISDPQPNHLVIKEGEVTFYQPRIKQAQKYQMGNNKDKAEFLLIGFGTTRKALEETYNLELLGETTEIQGKSAHGLSLVPKSDKVSAFFSKIVLWIDPELWVPVRQQLVEPTGDHLLVEFRNIEVNPKLSTSDFDIKLPKDVKIVGNP